jgi:preprotein translocase subunit SecG
MFGILLTLVMIVSILLVIAVLMQNSKGGGLAGSFGGSSVGTVFGVRRTADFLSRATTYLAIIFIGLCLAINILFLPGKATNIESIIQKGSPTAVPSPLPPRSQPAATPQQQNK